MLSCNPYRRYPIVKHFLLYLISILEFAFKDSVAGTYLQNFGILNKKSHQVFTDRVGFIFLELPNFVKTEEELETDFDRWYYLLKHMGKMSRIPNALDNKIFRKIFKIAALSRLTKEEKAMYDSSLKARIDYENTVAFAEEKAAQKAAKIATAKATHQTALDIARNMKIAGVDLDQIALFTGLPITEIEEI